MLIKSLLEQILPKERPKFFDDPYLEMQFKMIEKKKIASSPPPPISPQIELSPEVIPKM
jgi:hypothetical protein